MGQKAITGRNMKILLGTTDPADQAMAELRSYRFSRDPETIDLTSTDDTERDIRSGAYTRELEVTTWWANPSDAGQDLVTEGAVLWYILHPDGAGSGKRQIAGQGEVGRIEDSGDVDGGVEMTFVLNRATRDATLQGP